LIIIDGYNLIFTVPELEKYVEKNCIESVRDYVITLLSHYRQEKRYGIIIVFDGTSSETTLPRRSTYKEIEIVYSKTGTDADTEIKNITSKCKNPKDVRIVTYDNEIKRHVKKCGCETVEPKSFFRAVYEVLNKKTEKKYPEPESKWKGPSKMDAEYWKDIFQELPSSEENPISAEKADRKKTKRKGGLSQNNIAKNKPPQPDLYDAQYWVRIFEAMDDNENKG